MREGADVGLLEHVLRLGVVIQNGASDPVEPLIVTLDDQPEGRPVPPVRAFNQGGVVEVLEPAGLDRFAGLHRGAPCPKAYAPAPSLYTPNG